jgi:flagellar hook-associated protein 3 FlgL
MQRVSTDMMNDDMQYWLRRSERGMASMENKMARQSKAESLRDDPLAAARAVRLDSVVGRLQRFESNASYVDDAYRVSEGYARQALEVTQRLREIAVQGANGVYTKQDQKAMAAEVDQLMAELVELGNAKGADGSYLFSGDKSRTAPFRAIMGGAPGAEGEVLTGVQYLGAVGGPSAEVTEGSYIETSQPGSEVFWAEKQQAVSTFDARDWRAVADQTIVVDGKSISIKAGDNVHALAAKINDSGAAVKATIDPRRFSLALETTSAHQLRLEDGAGGPGGNGGNALKELGLLAPTGSPPDNWAPTARVTGGSLFDVAIRLRDALNRGDGLEAGGAALAGIDAGVDSLGRRVAELGARSERLQAVKARLNVEIPDTTKLLAGETDLDMTQAITDYKMLEYAHSASLGMAGRLLPKTLLDFLR